MSAWRYGEERGGLFTLSAPLPGVEAPEVVVVAGHFIDPGTDVGAPGERETNMALADGVERELRRRGGWRVTRPDVRPELRGMSWAAYQRWVAARTRAGVPVVEIHGQGRAARPGFSSVVGVIAGPRSPLADALEGAFGRLPNDPLALAVPRNGGVLLEAYDSDSMAALEAGSRAREEARLALAIADALERAERPRRGGGAPPPAPEGCSSSGCVLLAPEGEEAEGATPLD